MSGVTQEDRLAAANLSGVTLIGETQRVSGTYQAIWGHDGYTQTLKVLVNYRQAAEAPLLERIAQLEADLEALVEAVEALPVEEWIEQDRLDGTPLLIGYVMQAQGEWDRVTQALARIKGDKP